MTASNTTAKCHTCQNLHSKRVDLLIVDYCAENYYTPPRPECPCYIAKEESFADAYYKKQAEIGAP